MVRDELVRIEVHRNLQDVLENFRGDVANKIKASFGLSEISIPRTLSSEILAAKLQGKKTIDIKIRKTGLNTGALEIIG